MPPPLSLPLTLTLALIIIASALAHLQIDDAAIQVYKDGDFGAYLDLESSLAEQTEEIEGLQAR